MKRTIFAVLVLALLVSVSFAQDRITSREEQLKPRYEKREAFTVAGVETLNDMEDETYAKAWQSFLEIQPDISHAKVGNFYGITYTAEGIGPEKDAGYMYFVGMEVMEGMKIPEKVKIHKVPSGYYAVFQHHGNIESIEDTYEYIYGRWIFESGNKPADQDMFELYDERFHPESEDSVIEIWVPIVARGEAEPKPEPKQELKQAEKEELNPRVAPEVVPDNKPDMGIEKE
ncbi:MAG: GyrI-like domain-containing protein [Candidatus Syntrophosphaera sp.]